MKNDRDKDTGAERQIQFDKIIKQLVPQPGQPPDAKVLAGFLGESSREGHWRLYLTPQLDHYVEIPRDAILHTISLESKDNPIGGTVVWVRREANLVYTKTASREAQADFFQGSIHSAACRRPRPGMVPGGLGFATPGQANWSMPLSCIHEFCDWIVYSFWAGGDVYCTDLYQCN
jgi:hypothetical protein